MPYSAFRFSGEVPEGYAPLGWSFPERMAMVEYFHSGKFGDIVFSVPAYRELGCVRYNLVRCGRVGSRHWEPSVVIPLLDAQGIECRVLTLGGLIPACEGWCNGDRYSGVAWRRRRHPAGRPWNLAERHCLAAGVSYRRACVPWLRVQPQFLADVLFVRSPRYRPVTSGVDWRELVLRASGSSAFLGLESEYWDFCSEFNVMLPFVPTRDYLQAARYIAGSRLVVTNQTGLHAVAAGLGVALVLERCERIDCCRFGWETEFLTSVEVLRIAGALSRWPDHKQIVQAGGQRFKQH
jgi:hypothetical protein